MSVLRTLAATFATKGAGMVLTFAVGVILSRVLGPSGRGQVDVLVNVFALLLLSYPSLEEPQLYALGQGSRPPATLFANGLLAAAAFGALALGAAEVAIRWFPGLLEHRDRATGAVTAIDPWFLRILILAAPLEIAHRLLGGLLQGLRDMRAFNAAHLVQNGALLALAAALVAGAGLGVKGAVVAHVAAIGLGGLTAVILAARHPAVRAGPFRPDLPVLAALVGRGLRLHGGVVAAWVILQSDVLVLHRFQGQAEVGLYALAVALTGHLRRLVLQPVKEVLGSRLPAMVDDPARTAETVARTCRHTLVLGTLAALGLAAAGYPLIVAAYGRAFAASFLPLLILLPGSLLWSAAVVLSYWFIGRGRFLTLTAIGAAVGATNLGLNLLFVPRAGMMAAAWSSTACYGLHLAIFLVVLRRAAGLRPSDCLRFRREDLAVWGRARAAILARIQRRT